MPAPTPGRAPAIGLLLTALLLAPGAAAQVGTFGSMVRLGDSDYWPLAKGTTIAPAVSRYAMGTPDDWSDDCLILDTATSAPFPIEDIRLTPCNGKAPGTRIAATDREEINWAWTTQTAANLRTRHQDVNLNAKFDTNEPMYLTYFASGVVPATGFAATEISPGGADGDWTVRLMPTSGYAAGSLVNGRDADFVPWGTDARNEVLSLVEREDKGWYLVPLAVGTALKNLPLPVKSVRVAIASTVALQPNVQPSGLDFDSGGLTAGGELKVTVRYSNDGNTNGAGLLVTRLDGAVVDVRLTPLLNPGQTGSAILDVELPDHGGEILLEVSGFKVTLDVEGPAEAQDEGAAAVAALEARIAQLEAAGAAADSGAAALGDASAAESSPGFTAAVLLGALALVVLARRRGD